MAYFVYILRCKDKSLYAGYTTDIKKRLAAHNNSKHGARYTKTRRPVVLVYSEKYRILGKALKREHEIKSWTRVQKLALIKRGR
jgi:putative endonuclease